MKTKIISAICLAGIAFVFTHCNNAGNGERTSDSTTFSADTLRPAITDPQDTGIRRDTAVLRDSASRRDTSSARQQ